MPVVLATLTTPTQYLAESRDSAWLRADCALNAVMWEDLDGLRAWVDALPPDRIVRLDAVGVQPVAVELDGTGVSWSDYRASVERALLLDQVGDPVAAFTVLGVAARRLGPGEEPAPGEKRLRVESGRVVEVRGTPARRYLTVELNLEGRA